MDIRRVGNVPGEVSQPLKKQKVSAKVTPTRSDRIEISDSARAAQEANMLVKAVKGESDIRPERVEEVRRAVAEGVLLSPEATKRLAERLADIL